MSNKNVLDSIRAMRQTAKETEVRYYPKSGNGQNKSMNDFAEGKTYLRVAPSHDTESNPSPFYPLKTTWLEVELGFDRLSRWNIEKLITEKSLIGKFGVDKVSDLSDWDDDKVKDVLKKELGASFKMKTKKKIFISTLHGQGNDVDLVEEYIKFVVKKVNDEIGDRDEARKKLSPIFGWRDNNGWHPGITPSTSYVFYAWEWSGEKNFYKVEIYDKYMDKIEELYAKFDTPEEPLTIDPFSHPTEGVALVFDKFKNDKNKFEFSIYDQPFDGRKHDSFKQFIANFAISEDQMSKFKEVKPLANLIGRGVFKRSDFELQLNGLVLFDEKHGFNAFENDEFLEIVQAISEQYPEEEKTPYNPLIGEGEAPEDDNNDEPEVIEPEEEKSDIDKVLDKKPGKVAEKEKEVKVETEIKKDSVKETSTKDEAVQDKLAALRKRMNK